MNDINYGGIFMGNSYRDLMFSNKTDPQNDLLKKRENPILEFVEQKGMKDYVVFEGTRAMEIFLHSKKYKVLDFDFQTEDPYWANPEFEFEQKYLAAKNEPEMNEPEKNEPETNEPPKNKEI